jgi:hypothetical protein
MDTDTTETPIDNFSKIKELIAHSSLSLGDKIDFLTIFTKSTDAELADVTKLFSADPFWIPKMNENYKAKVAARATDDPMLWKKIIEEEEALLRDLENTQFSL